MICLFVFGLLGFTAGNCDHVTASPTKVYQTQDRKLLRVFIRNDGPHPSSSFFKGHKAAFRQVDTKLSPVYRIKYDGQNITEKIAGKFIAKSKIHRPHVRTPTVQKPSDIHDRYQMQNIEWYTPQLQRTIQNLRHKIRKTLNQLGLSAKDIDPNEKQYFSKVKSLARGAFPANAAANAPTNLQKPAAVDKSQSEKQYFSKVKSLVRDTATANATTNLLGLAMNHIASNEKQYFSQVKSLARGTAPENATTTEKPTQHIEWPYGGYQEVSRTSNSNYYEHSRDKIHQSPKYVHVPTIHLPSNGLAVQEVIRQKINDKILNRKAEILEARDLQNYDQNQNDHPKHLLSDILKVGNIDLNYGSLLGSINGLRSSEPTDSYILKSGVNDKNENIRQNSDIFLVHNLVKTESSRKSIVNGVVIEEKSFVSNQPV